MKKKLLVVILFFIVMIGIIFELVPYINEGNYISRTFNDLKDKIEEPLKGVIGIIPESEEEGLKSHNGYGSGVIFERDGNTYYAVTAKHVVSENNSKFKIFTVDTDFSGEVINVDDIDIEIPDDNYYESLLDSKIEYMSDTCDLAILSFQYDGELTVLEFENKEIKLNDRVIVIGHPEGDRYKVSYGYIKSGLEKYENEYIIKHNAYMEKGNSGGVALSEDMKIIGINIAGSFSLFGSYKMGFMIPYDIVINNINEWRNNNE